MLLGSMTDNKAYLYKRFLLPVSHGLLFAGLLQGIRQRHSISQAQGERQCNAGHHNTCALVLQ